MQRRSFLNSLSGSKNQKNAVKSAVMPPLGLEKFTGPWTKQHSAHLLRRTVFGAEYHDIAQFTAQGMDKSIDILTNFGPVADPPVNYDFESDPKVPIGATWVNKGHDPVNNTNNYRYRSLFGWTMGRMMAKEMNVREKMTLFWHNHFVVSDINDARYYYKYIDTFRQDPLGNFKEFAKKMTIDPAMLRYLNGNQNTKNAPNENFARELLELFTIGKGPIAGPGDYTHYTEVDVLAIARVLTGWTDVGFRNPNVDLVTSTFRPNQHDITQKKLSHRFNNATINNGGAEEYKTLIDIIFTQDEVSRFIARKLYRWFVYYQIDANIETTVIEPMAQIIRDNGYNLKPALVALFSSAHFYSDFGCMIKHPLDFVASATNQTGTKVTGDLAQQYNTWNSFFQFGALLQMRYFDIPSVAGWKAYYQEPLFYQTWINSVTLPLRKSYTDALTTTNLNTRGIRLDIDVLAVIKGFSNPVDIETLINDLALVLLAKPLSENQLATLKELMIPGLPDYEWTVEYEDHLANPTDLNLRRSVEGKLRNLFNYMMKMPEYQLC
ncbi:MAG: DUF1800 domain-containing protein [Saprospiraceae bacterium]|nr:DUF1800 domain-containing protein [Saprospiraceae bacterium]